MTSMGCSSSSVRPVRERCRLRPMVVTVWAGATRLGRGVIASVGNVEQPVKYLNYYSLGGTAVTSSPIPVCFGCSSP